MFDQTHLLVPLLYSLLQPYLVITRRPPNQQLLLQLDQNDICVFSTAGALVVITV